MSPSGEIALSLRVRTVLEEFAHQLGPSGVVLITQAGLATAKSETPTWVDIHLPSDAPRGDWPDGPLSISPTVLEADGNIAGSIHVWIAAGLITAIEQGWVTDAAPKEWPVPERLQW